MSNTEFKNRVYGCVVVKAINANYNADFSGLPRRLKSDGSFYATDKSFKWLVRNYIKKNYSDEKILFTKVFDDNFVDTVDLKKAFEIITDTTDLKELKKKEILPKLTECIDVRLFGAVFSPENAKKDKKDENKNISIHGNVQINHATDLYKKGRVYTDEILAPFTAIGSMSKATEAHYIHNFSVNPKNLSSWENVIKKEDSDKEEQGNYKLKLLSQNDIIILKNAFNNSATFYDSHSKAGVENELSIYVTLKENSTLTLPSFSQFIKFHKAETKKINIENNDKEYYEKDTFDLTKLLNYLEKYNSEIECIEIYAIEELVEVICGIENDKIIKCDLLQLATPLEVKKDEKTN